MKCDNCGGCCSNLLPVTNREIKTIRKYIKRHRIAEIKSMNPLDCPFLDKEKDLKCRIYEVRPRICREFFCSSFAHFGVKGMHPVDVRETFYGSGGKDGGCGIL